MKLSAWGRLLRLSLAPSAAADAAAGLCLGHAGRLPLESSSLLVVCGSLCIYHGGMVLNDWADRLADAATRPDRPLPSGAIQPRTALLVALALLVAGPLLVALADPRLAGWAVLLALLVALYDLFGRGAMVGPLLLGGCRALNLALGVLAGSLLALGPHATSRRAWLLVALYGAYVFFASRTARLEDDEDDAPLGRRPSAYLSGAVLALAAVPLAAFVRLEPALVGDAGSDWPPGAGTWLLRFGVPVALVGWSLVGLLGEVARRDWTRPLVGRAMGMALRRLLVFTAAAAWLAWAQDDARVLDLEGLGGHWVAALILMGYPISHALRSVFPPT